MGAGERGGEGYSGFQVTGMIKGFWGGWGLKFLISGFFLGRKILTSNFWGKLELSREFLGYSKLMFLFFV